MTRTAALRASILFACLTVVFGAVGLASHAPAALALVLIGGAMSALMLLFRLATPSQLPAPARIRRMR